MKQKDKYKHLPFEERERLFTWFKSQQKWNERQPKNDWHKRQAMWFKNNARWLFTLSEIVSRTLRKHSAALTENVQMNNSLMNRLRAMSSNVQGDRRCAASSRSVQRAKRTGSTAGLGHLGKTR